MQPSKFLLLCGLLAGCAAVSHAQAGPVLTGYVSRSASASDFDVDTFRILCKGKDGDDSKSPRDRAIAVAQCPDEAPHIGDTLVIHYNVRDTAINGIYATRIDKQPRSSLGGVSGAAVIDAIPTENPVGGKPADLIVRADGYRIRITAKTKIGWIPPLQSLADVKAGDWIRYKGKFNAAGILDTTSAQIGQNAISDDERRLRTKKEYDPATVPANAKQNLLKDAFAGGPDPRKFPPFKDDGLQARIEKIGNSLVPAYQRALPASDPAKTNFRFQLIDTKLLVETFTVSNGIILIPHQTVERMENDSQLAAVLADGIARVLERQEYRLDWKIKSASAASLAAPILPIGTIGDSVAREIEKKAMEQRMRVSLGLLWDAGYDMAQAPIVWWLLTTGKPKEVSGIEVPERAAYLYRILGETWRDSIVPAPAAH